MKLMHLSITSIVGCLLGLLFFAGLTLESLHDVRSKQSEVTELLNLQARTNDFSLASDSLLLLGGDASLLAAYRKEARALQAGLQDIGGAQPRAQSAIQRVDEMLKSVLREARVRSDMATEGLPPLQPRNRIVMNQVASLGGALDASLDHFLQERQREIAREANWIVGLLAGAALLFGALSVLAFTLIHRRIVGPAQELGRAMQAIRGGKHSVRASLSGNDELTEMGNTLNRMLDERQAIDEQLRERNRRLQEYASLVEHSRDQFCIIDSNYRYRWVNRAYADQYSATPEAMQGKALRTFLGETYFRKDIQPRLDRCLAGAPQHFETERRYADGVTRRLLVRYSLVEVSGESTPHVSCVITDITDISDAERALDEQARLLDMAGRMAQFGAWSVDLASEIIAWSNTTAEIHGMPEDYSPSVEEGIKFYAPEYRDRIRACFTACVHHGEPYDERMQIIKADGQRVWVRTMGEAVRDSDGVITRIQGAFQDITVLQEHETALRASRNKLAALLELRAALLNSLPAHIALLDDEGNVIDVNDQWRHFGEANAYSGDDLGLGRNYIQVCEDASGDQADEAEPVAAGLRAVLAGRQDVFTLEYPCHSPDQFRWFRVMANRLVGADEQSSQSGAVVMHIDITERKLAEQELNRLAFEDRMTGLLSRNGFAHKLTQAFQHHGWNPDAIMVMVDIVNLHDLNDAQGYEFGDQLLTKFGQRLTAEAQLAGRAGGDVFVAYLALPQGMTAEDRLIDLSEALSRPYDVSNSSVEVGFRIGYSELGRRQRGTESLMREAELALFENRKAGTTKVPWAAYSASIDERARERVRLTRDLRTAVESDELELHYQPKVNLQDGSLIAAEALLRWHHPERGLLPPAVFIPLAEQSQLIGPIGNWALRAACRQLREWRDADLDIVRVAVNVSLVQFTLGGFPETVASTLDEFGVDPQHLSLEITESVFEQASERLLEDIHALHELGVRLSLDDFGTGYSSLLYLQRYPFDEIKIDQGFVRQLLDDPYSHNIVRSVVNLADALNAEVVAEGIESAAIRDVLQSLGCSVGQGYYYSVPLEAEDFRWLLERRSNLPLSTATAAGTDPHGDTSGEPE